MFRVWLRTTTSLVLPLVLLTSPARADTESDYRQIVLRPDYAPFRYYTLADPPGSAMLERVAGRHGTWSNPVGTLPAGPFYNLPRGGSAVQVSSSSRYGSAAVGAFGPALTDPSGATIVVWFRTTSVAQGTLVGCYNGSTGNGFEVSLSRGEYFLSHSLKFLFAVTGPDGVALTTSAVAPRFNDGDWHMLACTIKGQSGRCYFDGDDFTAFSVRTHPGTPLQPLGPLTSNMGVGAALRAGAPELPANAEMSRLSLHTTALSAAQVRGLWDAGNGYTSESVYFPQAVRPWFEAAGTQRVDAMVMGDSNLVHGVDGGVYGHQFGFAQGLRRVFPVYASAVLPGLNQGIWGGINNGIQAFGSDVLTPTTNLPPHVAAAVPPFTQGFPTAVAYATPQQAIAATSNFTGSIDWQSPDLLFDFTRRLDLHFTYATFSDTTATAWPNLRKFNWPYTPLGQKSILTSPLGASIYDDRLLISAGPRDQGAYGIFLGDINANQPAQGPFAFLYWRFVLPDIQRGASLTPAWGAGGVGARVAADVFVNHTTLSQLGSYLRQTVRHQPAGMERLLFQIIEGQNDLNDTGYSVRSNGSIIGIRSYTREGQKINTLSVMRRVRDAWVAQGYDPAKLCFVLGPYHPGYISALSNVIPVTYTRGWKELALENPDLNIAVMNAYGFTSAHEAHQGNWYEHPPEAHLNRAGAAAFGIATWKALALAAGVPRGACCSGQACTIEFGPVCSAAEGSRFSGDGTTCAAANTPACCRTDFNADGALTVQDVFDYLSAWFAANPRADWDDSGGRPTINDIMSFLRDWFAGCQFSPPPPGPTTPVSGEAH